MKEKLFTFLFTLQLAILFASSSILASTRGIHIVSRQGQTVYLYKDYHALVIGVSDYDYWPKLPNGVKDAKDVAEKLKAMDFQVKLVLDPTSKALKAAINDLVFMIGVEENRAILIYFAGHGETEVLADNTRIGYIVPKDCPTLAKDPLAFSSRAVSMREIELSALKIKSKHVLMVFDSCFSGTLFNLVRSIHPLVISEKSGLSVRQFITSGSENEVVPDNSMFKRCFLVGLEGEADLTGDGYVTGSELGMYLSEKVVNYTNSRQHPQYGKINNPNLDRGDFIFVPQQLRDTTLRVDEDNKERAITDNDAKKSEQVRMLIDQGQAALIENRIETPPNNNAVDYAAQALELMPNHLKAIRILGEVLTIYVLQGEAALKENDLEQAKANLFKAQSLADRFDLEYSGLNELIQDLEKAKSKSRKKTIWGTF